jgi:glycosyltransferase involved in cell wall biosynthesis
MLPLTIEAGIINSALIMPTVSVVIPCYNEQDTIPFLLDAIYHQTYPRDEIEVIIADGLSTDMTVRRIEEFHQQQDDLFIKIVQNPARTIPSALNIAIRNARGEYIIRLDAHSIPYPDYIEKCIIALREKHGDNVGGKWEIQPGGESWIARSIAVAAAHPLGAGDAKYRIGGKAQAVDTVPFGAFRKSLFEELGGFNEKLLTNEDYEFNTRIRLNGGTIWFDPSIQTSYFARKNLKELARQYWRYGYWKGRMIRRYPQTLRWRQLIPPLFVLSLICGSILSLWLEQIRILVGFEVLLYSGTLEAGAVIAAVKKKDWALLIGFPLAMITIHLCWGTSFLWSFIKVYDKTIA